MSDYLETLPTDNDPVSSEEKEIFNMVLQNDTKGFQNLLTEFKTPIVIGAFFVLISMPQVSEFIKNTISYTKTSETSMLIFKTLLMVVFVFVYMNFAK